MSRSGSVDPGGSPMRAGATWRTVERSDPPVLRSPTMSTITSLAGGLAGAVGCDFRQAQNQLLFVEFAGRLSRLNLYRSGVVISSGTGILKGTWPADLDAVDPFAVSQPFATVDIQWRQHTDVVRSMDAYNTATIARLGIVDFDAITPDTLASLAYAKTPIVGNFDATN